jgi:cation-transporting ATPase E
MAKTQAVRLNKVIARVEASVDQGLTNQQARERLKNGYANFKPDSAEKTVLQIFKENTLTYFNLVFAVLGLLLVIVGLFDQLFFMFIVVLNTIIGIIQALRSKAALAKLNFMSAPSATVIREGNRFTVPVDETVLDDIVVFSSGNQIYADAIVLAGQCQMNESQVTGESDEIAKIPGDSLYSGSFVVSGECIARLDKVGRDSFVAQLALESVKSGNKRQGMVEVLQKLIRTIGIIIVPLGIAFFILQLGGDLEHYYRTPMQVAVGAMVTALVGMIPEGLYLLVSVALTVSVLRLARSKTLVQDMRCVESLARVNILCVDKTGTITESRMDVKGAVLLSSTHNHDQVSAILTDYVRNMAADNETMIALQSFYSNPARRKAQKVMSFSSATKYSGVAFAPGESYLLGAPERILGAEYVKYKAEIDKHSSKGYRVLLFVHYRGNMEAPRIDSRGATPLALILLSNKIRDGAPETFRFFARQGVKIIVISGDNPVTVSQIAKEAGIEGAEYYIDAAELTTDKKIKRAISEYTVFGRVTPDQKRKLVRALKRIGHTVAMTGDGVNDVLALKDADCSIAMASGSEVASQVSDIVLLESDFSKMPEVVMEGRRVINNIERSASLFLVRNIHSFLLILITMLLPLSFPFYLPMQDSLFGAVLIGFPSFVLALQPNKSIVRGKFLTNIFRTALPAGLTNVLILTGLLYYAYVNELPRDQVATMSLFIIGFVGYLMLLRLCLPFNPLRITLLVAVFIGFVGGVFLPFGASTLGQEVFQLTPLTGANIGLTAICLAISIPVQLVLTLIFDRDSLMPIKRAVSKR